MRELVGAVAGLVSVWWGRPGGPPTFAHRADEPHYAASLMKLPLLVAARGVDTPVAVHNSFPSAAAGAPRFGCEPRHDSDPEVWARLGDSVGLAWLGERMISHSSNLASNLVLQSIGLDAADAAWRAVGARRSTIQRGIEDAAAAAAGLTNLVTCADLARLLASLDPASTPTQVIGTEMISALPPATRVIRKGGWVLGVRHCAGLVLPGDAPPFILAVCLTTPAAVNRSDDEASLLIHRLTARAWAARHDL